MECVFIFLMHKNGIKGVDSPHSPSLKHPTAQHPGAHLVELQHGLRHECHLAQIGVAQAAAHAHIGLAGGRGVCVSVSVVGVSVCVRVWRWGQQGVREGRPDKRWTPHPLYTPPCALTCTTFCRFLMTSGCLSTSGLLAACCRMPFQVMLGGAIRRPKYSSRVAGLPAVIKEVQFKVVVAWWWWWGQVWAWAEGTCHVVGRL